MYGVEHLQSDDEEEEEEGIDEDERRRSAEEAEQRRPAEEAEQRMSEERQRQPDDHSPPPDLMDVTEGDPEDPLERLEHKWGIARGLSPMAFLQLACSNLDALDDFDPMMIEAASRACWADFATCVQWYSVAFAQGREVALSQDEVMKRLEVVKGVMRQAKEGLLKLVPRNSWQEGGREEVSARTELLSASYDRASLIGLRALEAEGCEQLCYSEIKSNGYRTRAFKVETTIQQALFDTCDCLGNELLYNKLTSVGSFQTDIPAHIAANRRDPRFPLIQKDRHVFAFQNGLYVAWLRKSILKNDCGLTVADGEVSDLFIPYEGNQVEKLLRPEVCACKYFDMPFDYAAHGQEIDWYQLATPNLQQILDAQRLPEEACKWVYVLIGRMLYSVGELDNLHLIVYLKGVAGTGE